MEYKEYLIQMRGIQQNLVDYFDNDERNISIINQFFTDLKTKQNSQQIKELLHFISKFSNNYHRSNDFFTVFEEIINIYKDDIIQNFTNRQIFRIFHNNKRILLILFEAKILKPDIYILKTFLRAKYIDEYYLHYFYPEFKNFLNEKLLTKINNSISYRHYNSDQLILNPEEIESDFESFIQKRKKGENDKYICELIQNDAIEDFVTYVNRKNFSLTSRINDSIFETNSFLLKSKNTTLIEYASFFGSIQIFKYLYMNNVELTQSMWLYSIHGKNPEIIHFLEENKIDPILNSFEKVLIESIKCHHNEFSDYIRINLLNNTENSDFNFDSICKKYYNYYFFKDEFEINSDIFYDFCKFDYISIVEMILENNDIKLTDLNVLKITEDNLTIENYIITREQTPFHVAIRKGNLEIVKLMLKKLTDFDMNVKISEKVFKKPLAYENTLLSIAIQNYDIDMVNYLLMNTNVDINLNSKKMFSSTSSSPQNEETTPLQFAIINEDIDMINLLLGQTNIDVNKKSVINSLYDINQIKSKKTPLFHAIETENYEIVKILISRKDIKINEKCIFDDDNLKYTYVEASALVKAVLLGNNEIFNLLLTSEEIDYNCVLKFKKNTKDKLQEKSVFYTACELQRKEIVSSFISLKNLDVNYVYNFKFNDNEGFFKSNPLYIACDIEDPDIVKSLLNRKDIDINYKSQYQSAQKSMSWSEYREKSVLHHAIDKENIEAVRALLEHPKLNVNDIFLIKRKISFAVSKIIKKTALHLAIEKNSIDCVRLLLTRNDLQINMKYHYLKYSFYFINTEEIQSTALHMAVKNNCTEIVKLLLNYDGIDFTIKNESGKTPYYIAQNNEISELLKNKKK